MYSITQIQKAEKQRKSINAFLVRSPELEFDTIKAQILDKISESLKPKTIAFEHYSVAWTIPRTQASSMPLFSSRSRIKAKNPSVNLVIKARLLKNKKTKSSKKNSEDSDKESRNSESENSSTGDEDQRPKKKSKAEPQGKPKSMIETVLNTKINSKIQLLKNRWLCPKAGCSSDHCFVHPEHSDHFPLGHDHFAVWAAAWNKDDDLANIETPPNHHKFNMIPGRHLNELSPLLQRRLANRNQSTTGNSAAPVFNFNIPPELLNVFRPTNVEPIDERAPPTMQDQHFLPQPGSRHGLDLSLDDFCASFSLNDGIRTRLHENGYTSAETLTFIVVPELREMGFKFGEIAAMKAAMKHWSQ
ncbi:hypothetical protein F4604DRAFT_1686354 [Suillus subluteus]|nr:hypothetical protein F4604DRAFT_1686354 [Suillus subluteus]